MDHHRLCLSIQKHQHRRNKKKSWTRAWQAPHTEEKNTSIKSELVIDNRLVANALFRPATKYHFSCRWMCLICLFAWLLEELFSDLHIFCIPLELYPTYFRLMLENGQLIKNPQPNETKKMDVKIECSRKWNLCAAWEKPIFHQKPYYNVVIRCIFFPFF